MTMMFTPPPGLELRFVASVHRRHRTRGKLLDRVPQLPDTGWRCSISLRSLPHPEGCGSSLHRYGRAEPCVRRVDLDTLVAYQNCAERVDDGWTGPSFPRPAPKVNDKYAAPSSSRRSTALAGRRRSTGRPRVAASLFPSCRSFAPRPTARRVEGNVAGWIRDVVRAGSLLLQPKVPIALVTGLRLVRRTRLACYRPQGVDNRRTADDDDRPSESTTMAAYHPGPSFRSPVAVVVVLPSSSSRRHCRINHRWFLELPPPPPQQQQQQHLSFPLLPPQDRTGTGCCWPVGTAPWTGPAGRLASFINASFINSRRRCNNIN
jgi:hypothetical protein